MGLNQYLIKRKQAIEINKLLTAGALITAEVKKMVTAKIFKPSEFEIQDLLRRCKTLRNALIYYVNALNCGDYVNVDDISNLELNTLIDCSVFSARCFKICLLLQRRYTSFIYMPLAGNFLLVEAFFALCLIFIYAGLFM